MKFTEATLKEIENRISVVDIARNNGIQLKGSGKAIKAQCFQNSEMHANGDKTPSLSFKENENFCKCFGCQYTARPIKLYMDLTSKPFVQAVEDLAAQCNVTLEYEGDIQKSSSNNSDEIRNALKVAHSYYVKSLAQSSVGQDYLATRGFSKPDVKDMGAGFIPNDRGNGLLAALEKSNVPLSTAVKAGLITLNEKNEPRPTVWGARVVFPVADSRGRLVGFGARVLDDSKPKYVNTPETALFKKSEILFNLHNARPFANKAGGQMLVFEGYMDVNSLRFRGLENSVAAMGTALSQKTLSNLQKENNELVFCFDGDNAGILAADRTLANALPVLDGTAKLKFLMLPDGHDPDSYVMEHGPDKFKELVTSSLSLTEYFATSLTRSQGVDPEDIIQTVNKAGKLLTSMEPGLFQRQLIKSLAAKLDIEPSDIQSHVGLHEPEQSQVKTPSAPAQPSEAKSKSQAQDELPIEQRRLKSRVSPSTALPDAMASTNEFRATAAERAVLRPQSIKPRNATPEALFFNTHIESMKQLLSKPSIGPNDFVVFLRQTSHRESLMWHGELDADRFRSRLEGVMRRYIEPKMLELGVSPEVTEQLRDRLHSPNFEKSVTMQNERVLAGYKAHDANSDDVTMYKSKKKAEGAIPRMQQSASASPTR